MARQTSGARNDLSGFSCVRAVQRAAARRIRRVSGGAGSAVRSERGDERTTQSREETTKTENEEGAELPNHNQAI